MFSDTASATDCSGSDLISAMARMARGRLAGSLRTPGSGPSTGLSVSTSRQVSGRCLTSFCFCRERTTEGGMEKK